MLHVLVRTLNQNPNGFFSLVWVLGHHRIQYGFVQRQGGLGCVLARGGNFKTGAKQCALCFTHLHNHAIVRSHQHAGVKVHVVGHVIAALLDGFFHAMVSS